MIVICWFFSPAVTGIICCCFYLFIFFTEDWMKTSLIWSPQHLLIIAANLNNDVVKTISLLPHISRLLYFFGNFQLFILFYFIFNLWSAGTARFTRWHALNLAYAPHSVIQLYHIVSFSKTDSGLCIYQLTVLSNNYSYFTPCEFSHELTRVCFHCSLNDSKSPLVS